jgi:dodecin
MPGRTRSETRADSGYDSPTWGKDLEARRGSRSRRTASEAGGHAHRTAKVVELVGSSRKGFEDAIQSALEDARQTTRGIHGCEVLRWSIKCDDGEPLEYKVDLKVVFGIERTPPA